ncbi:glycosyltransferase family 2 protein [Pedobacter boryungensis]|uniref:Glycosyltransferase family 2 protein n=1 Tax=Pedobacter boryungensis TaxID=869962 RepID=A0ABX2D9T4_9SPHI|nr:glycosyltransferase family 2 protein [Pedobacter boryungensis]NQX30828.1 glycosyltransferase family 2 protein [Pedobacter boryungensis]
MEPSVAVVILNWNGKSWLERFLPSVVQTNYPNLQIIIGDNASTDDSISFLQQNYPQLGIIENDKNYGFAGGYNHILSRVTADYFVLLNSDVEVPANWIKPVIDLMESHVKIAVAQPKLKWQLKKTEFEYAGAAGGFIDLFAYPFCRGRIFDTVETDNGQYSTTADIFWASGAAFFIKSSIWKEVGGLDADLFAHMEEIDLCWRLKNLGYRVVCCTDTEVYHVGGGTLNANNPYKTYLNFRNNLIIMQKNLPKSEAYSRIFIRMCLDLLAWLQFLIKGKFAFAFSINKAHWHFLTQIGITSKKRITQIPLFQHTGVYSESIVWTYFVKKIKKFNDLKW